MTVAVMVKTVAVTVKAAMMVKVVATLRTAVMAEAT
jgi:hypothetical protein